MIDKLLEKRLDGLLASGGLEILKGGKKGLEKESLRIDTNGSLAQTQHPQEWGAPLTHPYITTDYSEALPELITPAFSDVRETINFLEQTHCFLYQHLSSEELLWAASMPCAVSDDTSIPIARYGTSNHGKMKHIYRVGLDWRYGRKMQAIAGVHFNYSLPPKLWPIYQELEKIKASEQKFINASYFSLIRNFKRLGWVVPFLFGSSPAVCKSFLAGRTTRFKQHQHSTYYLPHATSLRMSDIGYKNKNQSALVVSYDSLNDYCASLETALLTPYPEYEAIGLYNENTRIQLSTSILQIENEYYSFIRPKRTGQLGERSSTSLKSRGVEYVEIRALDLNCLSSTGVDVEQLYFLEAFLIFCLLEESPFLTHSELGEIEYNELTVALRGHEPHLELVEHSQRRPIKSWSLEICERMLPICEALDANSAERNYSAALKRQVHAIQFPETLPAAQILNELLTTQQPFQTYAMNLSNKYAEQFRSSPPSKDFSRDFSRLAKASHADQEKLERRKEGGLKEYIEKYLTD